MATNDSLKNQLSSKQGNQNTPSGYTIKQLMGAESVKKRFEEMLDSKASQFMASVINLVNGDTNLQKCDQMSVVSSAMVAATLDLPIDRNLGYAWVIPYGNQATFQLGYKGYIQLALRSGQYRNINVIEVYEGELQSFNRLTEEIELDFEKRTSDKVIGYTGFFELINGFRKTVYWSKAEIEKHKNKFSKSGFGWKNDWDAMAKKTVVRNMLNKWGILSIDMQKAYVEETKDPSEPNGEVIDLNLTEDELTAAQEQFSDENANE
ncbi:recombinase RecT [Oceanobacillus sp. E9]|uniref:recombinase RecT n=1 Tax=Oceanobacillus sp. E9 TaxID=1742575 RepID=UPI00084E7151|nr:recombinase RecT [Oceanobacillus sp. E9]OEH53145.1 recombinase RecT [Oceanobacillus sp. E9]